MSNERKYFVRTQDAPELPPPTKEAGVIGWLWRNVFSSMVNFNSLNSSFMSLFMVFLTAFTLYLFFIIFSGIINFTIINATFFDPEGVKGEVCKVNDGACWPFVAARFKQFMFGFYPEENLWRAQLFFAIMAITVLWSINSRLPYRRYVAFFAITILPLMSFILLTGADLTAGKGFWLNWPLYTAALTILAFVASKGWGGEILSVFSAPLKILSVLFIVILIATSLVTMNWGLDGTNTETSKWGGLMITLVIAITGIATSLPLGILLALGRRSQLPLIRYLSIVFIEFWRGIPLVTVLFMSSVMLPFFLPPGVEFNKLLRALIGITLFSSAYMAEVVRGGLQAISRGQFEGAMALGLPYWKTMRLIILPQAIVMVIPGIVNTFIGLFKDTTLVTIVGLFDLLASVHTSFSDATWATHVTPLTGYMFLAFVYFCFCFSMSRYSQALERKMHRGHQR